MNAEEGIKLASNYPNHFQDMDLINLKSQMKTAANLIQRVGVKSIHNVVKQLTALPEAFDQLLKLLKSAITYPVGVQFGIN